MKNLFSMDSKFYQMLVRLSEVIILNVLYTACCVPVVTIGAAQAGMMNAVRTLQDKEDDSSCYRAFFRGFASGFGKITIVWVMSIVVMALLTYSTVAIVYYDGMLGNAPVIMSVIALALFMVFQSMTVTFHSRFDCSVWQIIRSSLFMILMHPIRAVCVAVAIWGPVILMLLDTNLFLTITPVFMFIYYTVAFQFAAVMMKAPFAEIEAEHFSTQERMPDAEGNLINERDDVPATD